MLSLFPIFSVLFNNFCSIQVFLHLHKYSMQQAQDKVGTSQLYKARVMERRKEREREREKKSWIKAVFTVRHILTIHWTNKDFSLHLHNEFQPSNQLVTVWELLSISSISCLVQVVVVLQIFQVTDFLSPFFSCSRKFYHFIVIIITTVNIVSFILFIRLSFDTGYSRLQVLYIYTSKY